MKTIEYRNLDKSQWGPGLWQDEPDKVQWQDEATGLPCLAVRNSHLGHWCGYVGVAEGHPFFERGYSDDLVNVEVHGGLTFADFCLEEKDVPTGDNVICHIPDPGEPERVWWLGFDCAHCYDLSPGTRATLRNLGFERGSEEIYRPLAYVKNQCAELAQQLLEAAKSSAEEK